MPLRKAPCHRHGQSQHAPRRECCPPALQLTHRVPQPVQAETGGQQQGRLGQHGQAMVQVLEEGLNPSGLLLEHGGTAIDPQHRLAGVAPHNGVR